MFLLTRKSRQFPFVAVGLTLTMFCIGCNGLTKYRHVRTGKACLGEMVGVEDPAFYGHTKTCWKTWHEDAWSASSCPPDWDIPAAPLGSTSPFRKVDPIRSVSAEQAETVIERCSSCTPAPATKASNLDSATEQSDLGKFSPLTTLPLN